MKKGIERERERDLRKEKRVERKEKKEKVVYVVKGISKNG